MEENTNNIVLDEVTGEFVDHIVGPKIQVLDENTGTFKFVSVPPDDCEVSIVEKRKQRKSTRKRTSNPQNWNRNERKKIHQAGEEYTNSRGKVVPAKTIKHEKNCLTSCKFYCDNHIDTGLKKEIHTEYYKLNQDQKYHFIVQTTERLDKKKSTANSQRKKFTFMYYFKVKGNMIRVCKTFYLNTLSISQKTVYGVHNRMNSSTGLSSQDQRGKHQNHKKISQERKDFVRKHIESLPTVEAHYCRKDTKRKYLDSTLTEPKLYKLYEEKCKEENNMEPVKQSYYFYIFNTEYNLGFHKQKKDRCNRCEEWKIAKKGNVLNEELDEKYQKHRKEKEFMHKVRNHDRISCKDVLCFDLQNIISCPHAEISCFFYFSKLNVYNLTAHFSKDKSVHCAIWNETWAGKAANDIASGLNLHSEFHI